MIIRLLNDVKQGHYLWMRKKNDENIAKIGSFGVIFLTLLVYYGSGFIVVMEIINKITGKRDSDTDILANVFLIFGPYLIIFFTFINPNINRKIGDEISANEKRRKKKVATIYFAFCVLAIPLAGIIVNLLNGH